MMNKFPTSGIELALHSAEEQCPMEYWVSHLKNLAISIVKKFHLPRHIGKKYSAESFWEVLIAHGLLNLSIDEAANQLNVESWLEFNKKRRKKLYPTKFQGEIPRKERKVPNGDQVRKYRSKLPKWMVKKLNTIIFDTQIEFARANGLIENKLCVIVDDNDMWYYGSDRYPENQFINKSNRGPGTSRRRKFCAVMIKSKTTYLYVGMELIRKHDSNVPFILQCIDRLLLKGFRVEYVMGDRWFPTYRLLAELNLRSIYYIGPYKKWPGIKREIEDYLKNGGDYIRKYTLKGAPAKYYHFPRIKTTIIFTNRLGRRLREIRADYLQDRFSLKARMKEIMVVITTFPPVRGRKRLQGWAVSLCQKYDRRWQIETAFRDLNRFGPPSNARTNTRKILMRSVQYWLYNAWQIERAKRRQKRFKFKTWRYGPTFRHFANIQIRMKIAEYPY